MTSYLQFVLVIATQLVQITLIRVDQLQTVDVSHLQTKHDKKFMLTLQSLQEKLKNNRVSSNPKIRYQLINLTKHCLHYLSDEAREYCLHTKRGH